MNRDEKLVRPKALPPRKQMVDGLAILCPTDTAGGSWISVNGRGVTFALINWYSVGETVADKPVSRGAVITAARAATSPSAAEISLRRLRLEHVNPFRLIGIFSAAGEIIEWRWDGTKLSKHCHRWKSRQWISSGFDEPAAQRIRGETFKQFTAQRSVGTLDWLRRLHRSHGPDCGPFSTCMHRADAASVSYTEVIVSPNLITMRYQAGSPCQGTASSDLRLPLIGS